MDRVQQAIIDILEGKIKHPNQQALDVHEPEKDELTADDFKKLRAMKKGQKQEEVKVYDPEEDEALEMEDDEEDDEDEDEKGEKKKMKEEAKKPASPFDWKNAPSLLNKKPGERTGHEAKKVSTGTVYTKKPVKEDTDQIVERDEGKPGLMFKKIAAKAAEKYGSKEAGMKVAGAIRKKVLAKEGTEYTEAEIDAMFETLKPSYTFEEYLKEAREQFGDEAAVKIASEAFDSQDISLFLK